MRLGDSITVAVTRDGRTPSEDSECTSPLYRLRKINPQRIERIERIEPLNFGSLTNTASVELLVVCLFSSSKLDKMSGIPFARAPDYGK
jgi:hypothetical protein